MRPAAAIICRPGSFPLTTPDLPSDPNGDFQFLRRVLTLAGLMALAGLIWAMSDVLLLIFGAVLFAVILRALADPLVEKVGLSDGPALLVSALAILIIIGVGVYLFGTQISAQLNQLFELLPKAAETVMAQLGVAGRTDLLSGTAIGNLISTAYTWATTLVSVLAGILIVVFGGVYLATVPATYRDGFIMLFPPSVQTQIEETINDAGRALRLWLTAQLIAMVIVGVTTAAGLWLIGLPSWLALGLIAGLAEFIPVVGPIASAIPGLLIAVTLGWDIVLWTLAVYIIVQQIESNLIMPLLVGQAVNIAPALGLFSTIGLSVLFGPLGLLFAFPLTVVADVAVRRLYIRDTLGEHVKIAAEKRD